MHRDKSSRPQAAHVAGCIATLVPAEAADLLPEGSAAPRGCSAAVVDETTTAYLSIRGSLDPAKELTKLGSQQVSGPVILCTVVRVALPALEQAAHMVRFGSSCLRITHVRLLIDSLWPEDELCCLCRAPSETG